MISIMISKSKLWYHSKTMISWSRKVPDALQGISGWPRAGPAESWQCPHHDDTGIYSGWYIMIIWNGGTRIFGIYLAYHDTLAWYIPCICRCPTYTWNSIRGISMDIPCISIEVDIHGISMEYTWYIHGYTWNVIWCIISKPNTYYFLLFCLK